MLACPSTTPPGRRIRVVRRLGNGLAGRLRLRHHADEPQSAYPLAQRHLEGVLDDSESSGATIRLGPDVIQERSVDAFLGHLPDDDRAVNIAVAEPGTPNEGLCVAMLGLLARIHRRSAAINLRLPELEDAATVAESFLSTLLVLYADEVARDGEASDIRADLLALLDHRLGSVAGGSSTALLSTNLAGTEQHVALRQPRVFSSRYFEVWNELEEALDPLLERFKLSVREDEREHLLTFAQQAVENAREHGYITMRGDRIPGVRFVRLRVLAAEEVRRASAPLGHYLERLAEGGRAHAFVEIYVGDPGRGISATIKSDDAIYDGPIGLEQARFTLALGPRGTCKPKKPGAGRGLVMMTRAVHELRAFMAIRTGRLFRCRHFLDPMGRLEPDFFDEGDLSFYRTYDWDESVRPRIEGTHVFCLVPVIKG